MIDVVECGDTIQVGGATITVAVRDPGLAAVIATQVARAVRDTIAAIGTTSPPLVRLRSRARMREVAAELTGAIAIVTITANNAKRLIEIIDGVRAAGAVGMQLVWSGAGAERIERHVFAALEHARASPAAAPIVVATVDEPVAALQLLVARRKT